MGLEKHFQYVVLLTRTTDPRMAVTRRYYGKLTDGNFFYRGIELRRHDTPPYIKNMQRKMMESLFEGKNSETVINEGISRALKIANRAIREVKMRRVDPRELVISKRLRKDLYEYRAHQPHIVAAMLGKDEGENSDYILLNTKRKNPYLRVMPVSLLHGKKKGYDKKKYAEMTRRAAWNLLRPFVPNEKFIGENQYRNMSILNFI